MDQWAVGDPCAGQLAPAYTMPLPSVAAATPDGRARPPRTSGCSSWPALPEVTQNTLPEASARLVSPRGPPSVNRRLPSAARGNRRRQRGSRGRRRARPEGNARNAAQRAAHSQSAASLGRAEGIPRTRRRGPAGTAASQGKRRPRVSCASIAQGTPLLRQRARVQRAGARCNGHGPVAAPLGCLPPPATPPGRPHPPQTPSRRR